MAILLLTSVLVLALIAFLTFAKPGPKEAFTNSPRRGTMAAGVHPNANPEYPASTRVPPRRDLVAASVGEKTESLMKAMGLEVVQTIDEDGRSLGYIARGDVLAENPQKVYVRAFDRVLGDWIPGYEVAGAIEFARSEGFNRTILVSTSGFSDDAILAAQGTTAELIDGNKLNELLQARGSEERN